MKKTLKKLTALVMGAGLLLSSAAMPALAAELPTLPGVTGWSVYRNNNAEITSGVDFDVKYGGKASFKVVSQQNYASNVYAQLDQSFAVKKGKTYVVKYMAKAKSATGISQCWDWGVRTNVLPFGGTFDWREFEFKYTATGDGTVAFRLIFEKPTVAYWIDNFVAYEEGNPEVNLVSNGDMELDFTAGTVVASSGAAGRDFVGGKDKIDIHKKHYPLFPAENITIDADLSDWEGIPEVYVPSDGTDTVWYIKEQPIDAYFTFKAAHDEKYFYVMVDVEDNKLVAENSASYWQKDSLQVGISAMDEAFGKEIGVVHTDEGGNVFNTSVTYQLKTKREGTHTIYEFALPWEKNFDNGILEGLFSKEKQERFKFTVIANDSDGNGRIGCTRLSPGMDDTKTSTLYPVFEVMDKKLDWSAYAKHTAVNDSTRDVTYEIGVWNNSSEERDITCTLKNGKKVTVKAKPYAISTMETVINYEKPGFHIEPFEFSYGGEKITSNYELTIMPDTIYSYKLIDELEKRYKELTPLVEQCESKNIPIDYEIMYYRTVERFIQYMRDDVEYRDLERIQYTYDILDELIEKAKKNMKAYIAGTETPRSVPKYVTSDVTTDGTVFMATMETDGKQEVRPSFFMGYIGYAQIIEEIPVLSDYGVSSMQFEIGPWDIIFEAPEGSETWYTVKESGADKICAALKAAEENNIAVHLLLAPHYFPEFMYKKFPDIKAVTKGGYGGSKYNILDERVREVIRAYLNVLIPKIKDYKSLKAVCLANEPGLDAAAADGTYGPYWIEFLKWKYPTIEDLNARYGSSYKSFEEVELGKWGNIIQVALPETLTPERYDYWEFNNWVHYDWFTVFKEEFDRLAPDIPLTTKLMWYLGSVDDPYERQRFNIGVDNKWFTEITDYNGNDAALYAYEIAGGANEAMSKALFYDYQVACEEAPVVNSEDHMIPDGYNSFTETERKHTSWDTWMHNFHGRTMNQLWSWVRVYGKTGACWLSPLFRPDVLSDVAEASMDINRLGWEAKAVIDNKAEVAVLYSSLARFYKPAHLNAVYRAYEGLYYNGHKTDILVDHRLAEKIYDYKMVIVPGVENITAADIDILYDYWKKGGKLIIMGKENLKYDDADKPHGENAKLTELLQNVKIYEMETNSSTVTSPNPKVIADFLSNEAKSLGLEKVVLVDAKTGEKVYETEYAWGIYEDDVIINACYYEYDNEMDVKVFVGGKEVADLTELRSMKDSSDGTIHLEAWRPVLIRANGAAELIK